MCCLIDGFLVVLGSVKLFGSVLGSGTGLIVLVLQHRHMVCVLD